MDTIQKILIWEKLTGRTNMSWFKVLTPMWIGLVVLVVAIIITWWCIKHTK